MCDWDAIDVMLANPNWWYRSLGVVPVVYIGHITLVRYTRLGFPVDVGIISVESGASTSDVVQSVEFLASDMLRKPGERVVSGRSTADVDDGEAKKRYPVLWEYLTATAYPDGVAREPASLLIFWQEGMLKGMLRDKDAGLCLWGAAKGLFPLLEQLDGMAGDPASEWRLDKAAGHTQAKRTTRSGGR